jgi:hypothetical protein
VDIPVVVAVDGAGDGGPRLTDGEDAFDMIVTAELLTRGRIEEDGLDAEERQRRRAGLRRNRARKRGDDDAAGLGLPVPAERVRVRASEEVRPCSRVDHCRLVLADVLAVPMPGFGSDGLADGTDDAETGEVVTLDELIAELTEETDGGRSRVAVLVSIHVSQIEIGRRTIG